MNADERGSKSAFIRVHLRLINRIYSARRAEIGSTDAARRAGRKLASNADAPNTAATPTSVVMSHGGVPKSNLRIKDAARIAHPVPITIPASANAPASFKISL